MLYGGRGEFGRSNIVSFLLSNLVLIDGKIDHKIVNIAVANSTNSSKFKSRNRKEITKSIKAPRSPKQSKSKSNSTVKQYQGEVKKLFLPLLKTAGISEQYQELGDFLHVQGWDNIDEKKYFLVPQKSIEIPSHYQQLEQFLRVKDWRKADEETAKQMLKMVNRAEECWLRFEDIHEFSSGDLKIIDQLWVQYSKGRFGFSLQEKIHNRLGGTKKYNPETWKAFCNAVGWYIDGSWSYYQDSNFYYEILNSSNRSSPLGHFPRKCFFLMVGTVQEPIAVSHFLYRFFGNHESSNIPRIEYKKVQELSKKPQLFQLKRSQDLNQSKQEIIDIDQLEVSVRYQELEQLLKMQDWRKADEETVKQMLEIMNRMEDGWPRLEDIANFPCADLKMIDRLWVQYSKGHFGFSVQKQIYQSLDIKYAQLKLEAFSEVVGWRVKQGLNDWLYFRKYCLKRKDLNFDLAAPKGHLPGAGWSWREWSRLGLDNKWDRWDMEYFLSRIQACGL